MLVGEARVDHGTRLVELLALSEGSKVGRHRGTLSGQGGQGGGHMGRSKGEAKGTRRGSRGAVHGTSWR
jgi:hypothetical protein